MLLLSIVANAMHILDGSRRPPDHQAKTEFSANYMSALEFFRSNNSKSTLSWIGDFVGFDVERARLRAFAAARKNLEQHPIRFRFSKKWVKRHVQS